MNPTLSLGIQMAQSHISVDDASRLGIISYLTFLKVKAESQFSKDAFTVMNTQEFIPETTIIKYDSLRTAVNRFIKVFNDSLTDSQSTTSYLALDNCLKFETDIIQNSSPQINTLLNNIYLKAKKYTKEPARTFGDRILTIQSLAAIRTYDHLLTIDKLAPNGDYSKLIDCLSSLKMKTFDVKKPLVLEVA